MAATDLRSQLERFRRTHPVRPMSVSLEGAEKTWELIECGEGERAMLLLPSGLHVGEMWFPVIPALERDVRVLAPSFPAVSGMEEMVRGLHSILDQAGVDGVSILGMSTSGWIAQTFLRRFPERVENLVLANTSGPQTLDAVALRRAHDLAASDLDRLLDLSHGKYYTDQTLSLSTRDFVLGYLRELRARTTQEEVLGLYRCALDFVRGPAYTEDDVAGWPGRVLIFETDNDAGYDPAARADLRALYPRARVANLGHAGHIPVFNVPDEMARVLRDFLAPDITPLS